MLSPLNRYQFARAFCWLMRKFGYAVMLYPDHFGHQAGDVEFDLRTKDKKLFYIAGVIPNRALLKMHKRYASVFEVPQWLRMYFLESNVAYSCLDEGLSRNLTFYNKAEVWAKKPALEFSEEEHSYGSMVLQHLGLKRGEYVAFHARDPQYGNNHHPEVIAKRMSNRLTMECVMTEEHPFQRHRNVDFACYYQAIDFLKTRGIKAVRIGSDVSDKFEHDNLVDYAGKRSFFTNADLADLYLMAHCKLYVGHATGVTHLSCIFNTPGVTVNWFPYHPQSKPTANITACRVKRIKYGVKLLNEFQSRHFFELAGWRHIYEVSSELETVPNSEEEILQTVQQAIDARITAQAS